MPADVEALLELLGRVGRPGRRLAAGVDLTRSVGMGEARRRRRDEQRLVGLTGDGRRPGYTRMWHEAAADVGADVADLGGGFLAFRRDGVTTRVWNNWVGLDDIVTARLAGDKERVHRLLTAAGLRVPPHRRFRARDLGPAREFLGACGGPCVVKPVSGAGGSGTTSGVRTERQLRRARLRAARLHGDLLIERQVPGDVLRFLFLDGELLDVIRRHRPTVTGDGCSTVLELIAAENERRFAAAAGERPWLLRADLDAVFTLEAAGLRLSSVPAPGARVAVKTAVSQNGPGDNESIADAVGQALVADAARAAATVGVRLAGVDIITSDASVSLRHSGGAVLEVNATPGLHYHYEVSDQDRAVPVAQRILERLLAASAAAVAA
jgi:D-alanine-D-alanine ligase-like ATP-grasp enzyme